MARWVLFYSSLLIASFFVYSTEVWAQGAASSCAVGGSPNANSPYLCTFSGGSSWINDCGCVVWAKKKGDGTVHTLAYEEVLGTCPNGRVRYNYCTRKYTVSETCVASGNKCEVGTSYKLSCSPFNGWVSSSTDSDFGVWIENHNTVSSSCYESPPCTHTTLLLSAPPIVVPGLLKENMDAVSESNSSPKSPESTDGTLLNNSANGY